MVKGVILKRLGKYIASSLLAIGIDFGLLFVLVQFFGVYYLWAATASFITGHSINYTISRFWNFKESDRRHLIAYALFVGFGALSLGATILLLKVFVDEGFKYMSARILSGGIVGLVNFTFNYYVTFKAHLIPSDIDKFHKRKRRNKKRA